MKNKKQTNEHRFKRLEKAVGELYIMIHHLNDAIKLIDEKNENIVIEEPKPKLIKK